MLLSHFRLSLICRLCSRCKLERRDRVCREWFLDRARARTDPRRFLRLARGASRLGDGHRVGRRQGQRGNIRHCTDGCAATSGASTTSTGLDRWLCRCGRPGCGRRDLDDVGRHIRHSLVCNIAVKRPRMMQSNRRPRVPVRSVHSQCHLALAK